MTPLDWRNTVSVLGLAAAILFAPFVAVAGAQPAVMPGPAMMGIGQDASAMADMALIHELVVNHDRITRTVTNLPDGIRTVTESTDPQLAQRIKEHVANMDQRVTAGNDPNLPPESPALHAIFRNHDKVQTTIETTATGVVVVQTSNDPETVAILQQHASEVSDLVKGGMMAMHAAMMKNGGMMAAMQSAPATAGAQQPAMPPGMTHEEHMAQMKKDAEMKEHGNLAMGFDQDKTTHHFTLAIDGGSISVDANDPADQTSRDQIRAHLKEIAVAFGEGDFGKPLMTHGEFPAGVAVMQRLKGEISYVFQQTERGGIVRISTANAEARAAIHEFLTYQIKEHATGDPLTVPNGSAQMPGHGVSQEGTHGTAAPQADHFERHFDNANEWAKSFDDPARDEWQMPARVIDALRLKPGQAVADIGAGTGYFTVRLAKSPAAPKVYAVDIEPSMVDYVTHRAMHEGLKNVVAVLGGADRSNLPEPVDLVIVVDTYHHIPSRVAYFTRLKTQMRPGARLAIIDFRKGAPSGPPEEFRMTPEQIDAELAKAGFARQASHDFLPQQMFLVYAVK
ncbi:MAG TPA: class I SAM-dependent methyltransferase [Bradyrhizobium sp.]|nr:class I SAM-dependent methyltransferase [Bradyrhizobium sp.]